jgi:hypothetical protein
MELYSDRVSGKSVVYGREERHVNNSGSYDNAALAEAAVANKVASTAEAGTVSSTAEAATVSSTAEAATVVVITTTVAATATAADAAALDFRPRLWGACPDFFGSCVEGLDQPTCWQPYGNCQLTSTEVAHFQQMMKS